jgi:hypothetical protein
LTLPVGIVHKLTVVCVCVCVCAANTDIIMDMVAKIQPANVALVHQMPFTTDQKGLAAAVEKARIEFVFYEISACVRV